MTFYPLGDTAVLISFRQDINRLVHRQVLQLTRYLQTKKIEGILFFVPAYCSLTVGYDPSKWNYEDVVERIRRFAEKVKPDEYPENSRNWKIPVCYQEGFGLDLVSLAQEKEVPVQTIIDWHIGQTYYVYMLGFLPGFVYLGDLSPQLHSRRKEQPRLEVPARSVAVAGGQTGIYPVAGPGGWQILGRTPIRIFNPEQPDPFWFEMADQVTFYPVTEDEYSAISRQDHHTQLEICMVHG